jgi:hypothetical protein
MFLAKIPRGVKAFRFVNEYKLKLNNVIVIDCLTCLLTGVGELCVVGVTVEGLVVGDVLANHLGRIRQRIQTLDRSILTPGQLGIDALQTLVRTEVSGLGIG